MPSPTSFPRALTSTTSSLARQGDKPVLAVPPVHLLHHLPHTHAELIFLTDLRQENVETYLAAIAGHQYGQAAFLEGGLLEGGLLGIDVVLQNPPPYTRWLRAGEAQLQRAYAAYDWAAANRWKGYVCGVELAIGVVKASWYKPSRWGDRLVDWFERTRR